MKALPWIAVAGLLLGGALPVQAASLLEGFESGLGGWILTPDGGSITPVTSYDGLTATEGSWFAQLQTGDQNQWVYMRKAVEIKAGDQVSMDWFFDKAGTEDDQAAGYVGFYDAFWTEKEVLFDLTESQPTWKESSVVFGEGGTYYLVVGVVNRGNSENDSTLGVDNVYVGPPGYREADGAVPEPLTVAGVCMGIGGLVGYIRRRRA